jgi:hypothetical protein
MAAKTWTEELGKMHAAEHTTAIYNQYRLARLDDLREGHRASTESKHRSTVSTSSEEADGCEANPVAKGQLRGFPDSGDPKRYIDEQNSNLQAYSIKILFLGPQCRKLLK